MGVSFVGMLMLIFDFSISITIELKLFVQSRVCSSEFPSLYPLIIDAFFVPT
jgi:hypothetical protein